MPSIRSSASAASTAPTRLAFITAVAPPDCPIIRLLCLVITSSSNNSYFFMSLYQERAEASRQNSLKHSSANATMEQPNQLSPPFVPLFVVTQHSASHTKSTLLPILP